VPALPICGIRGVATDATLVRYLILAATGASSLGIVQEEGTTVMVRQRKTGRHDDRERDVRKMILLLLQIVLDLASLKR